MTVVGVDQVTSDGQGYWRPAQTAPSIASAMHWP
jgi:hypothetical protein